eukprot:6578081-Prymnesium_polylepis.1
MPSDSASARSTTATSSIGMRAFSTSQCASSVTSPSTGSGGSRGDPSGRARAGDIVRGCGCSVSMAGGGSVPTFFFVDPNYMYLRLADGRCCRQRRYR